MQVCKWKLENYIRRFGMMEIAVLCSNVGTGGKVSKHVV